MWRIVGLDGHQFLQLLSRFFPVAGEFGDLGLDGFEFGATDETESQGAFAIGSTCAKKFPTARPMMVVDDEVEIGVDGDAVIDEFEVAFVN